MDGRARQDAGFGSLLRRCRLTAGLTQEELAEQSGLSVRTIADMERGRTVTPRSQTVALLADALLPSGSAHDEFVQLARLGAAGGSPALPAVLVAGPSLVPRQLPAAPAGFVGRSAEFAALHGWLGQDSRPAGTTPISVITGPAGVGKTALAVRWSHGVADQFPDGQLYVNLRGYDPDQPMAATDALAWFLRALGVAGRDIPAEAEVRAARYRSLVAARQMLVVLDNARSAEQVRPLLPGTQGCPVVVTSRDALAGLVARDGARRLEVDVLPLGEAAGLLRALIGGRAEAEPELAETLAVQCARLPLALRLAAELIVARPVAPLSGLVGELADQQQRLDMLEAGGDPRTAIRAVFSWSYLHLDAAAARAFRLTGLHPGADFELYAVAALTGTAIGQARQLTDLLARAHLIQPARHNRYGMHDLLRAYAAEQAVSHDAEPGQHAALTRLFDHYLRTAAIAMDALYPAGRLRSADLPPSAAPAPPLTDPAAARAWLDAELPTLVAVVAHTADHGWPGHATRLATAIFRYLEGGGHYPEAVAVYGHARRAARRAGDQAAEADAHNNASVVDLRQGRYAEGASHLQQALALYRQAGDQTGETWALGNLGIVDYQQGRYQQASDHHRQALALYRQAGDQIGEARTLSNLGLVELRQGRYRQSSDHYRQALALCRTTGVRSTEGYALAYLGRAELQQGRSQQAAGHLQRSLALFREIADPTGEAYALIGLGALDYQQARYRQAGEHYQQALALCRTTGNQSGEAEALNALGELSLATGEPGLGRPQHAAALEVSGQIGDCYEQATALDGLARCYDAAGRPDLARRHWQQALTLYVSLGTPEASQVRAQLSRPASTTAAARAETS